MTNDQLMKYSLEYKIQLLMDEKVKIHCELDKKKAINPFYIDRRKTNKIGALTRQINKIKDELETLNIGMKRREISNRNITIY